MDYLFCLADAHALIFFQSKTRVVALNVQISVSVRCKNACAIVKPSPYEETLGIVKVYLV